MIVLLIAALGLPPGDDAPSPRALFDLYRANFDGFRTLKLQWRRDHAYTGAWVAAQVKRLAGIDARIARLADDAGEDVVRELHRERARLAQLLASDRGAKAMIQAFLTDRRRFQMRTAPELWAVSRGEDDWLIPDLPLTPDAVKDRYVGFHLLSYEGDPARGFRRWESLQPGGFGSGGIYFENPPNDANDFPPLGARSTNWGGRRHPIDEFFGLDPEGFRTVGRASLAGREVAVIERRTARPASSGAALRSFDVVRASLDPSRGALPLRIEWETEEEMHGRPLPRPKCWRPDKVLEVTEIVEVPGAGAYPTRGAVRIYDTDPAYAGPENTFSGLAAGTIHEVPRVVMEETTWQAAKVEADALADESFALPFPEGQHYYDEPRGRSIRSGDEDRDPTRLPHLLTGSLLAGWAIYGAAALVRSALRRTGPRRLEPRGRNP